MEEEFHEIPEELQDTSNSIELSSHGDTTQTKIVQENENKTENEVEKLKKKDQVQASKQNPKLMYSLIQKSLWKT